MSKEWLEPVIEARMPSGAREQIEIAKTLGLSYRKKVCAAITRGITVFLESNDITIYSATYRAKSLRRIEEKIIRRGKEDPQRDGNGIRLIVKEEDRKRIGELIQSAYPATPKVFADGMPSIRDYADPTMRDFIKKNYNPNISDKYSALHVNILLLREGSDIYDLVEIQIMTPAELLIYNSTREGYLNGKH